MFNAVSTRSLRASCRTHAPNNDNNRIVLIVYLWKRQNDYTNGRFGRQSFFDAVHVQPEQMPRPSDLRVRTDFDAFLSVFQLFPVEINVPQVQHCNKKRFEKQIYIYICIV